MSFTLDLQKFAKKYEKNASKVVRVVLLSLGKSVVFRTPVGDPSYWQSPAPEGYVGGRARGNWQHGLSLNSTVFNVVDKSGGASISRITSSIPSDSAGKIHYILNNVPYILRLESGTLSPRQAPNGMVGITVKQFKRYVDNAARGLT